MRMRARTKAKTTRGGAGLLLAAVVALAGCSSEDATTENSGSAGPGAVDPIELPAAAAGDAEAEALARRARGALGVLPASVPTESNPLTPAKIDLGRTLYYETRLSRNHDISCNSCHMLDAYGVDSEPTSPGHRRQRGDRNSPTVYNAALHVAQFWDGRAPDVESQAKGPVLNPIEMASRSEEDVLAVLASIPGYVAAFDAAYPEDETPLSYDNMARAIGAFERKLTTPGRFDAFLDGDTTALSPAEQQGLETFMAVGCTSCHNGPAIGGGLYRKLGFVIPYETEDVGREKVTGDPADRHVFKVPSLRNVAETGPWLHDGSIETLPEMVRIMGKHQIGLDLSDEQVAQIVTFLEALTGEIDEDYVAKPELPPNGPDTPAPDPT